jgi:choline monooxygenase
MYHAWSYALDGRLIGAPNIARDESLDRETLGLVPVHLAVWEGLIWLSLAADPAPVTAQLEPALHDRFGELEKFRRYDVGSLAVGRSITYEIAANWKLVVENYLECYHCPVAHPGFSSVINVDPDSYALASSGYVSTQKGPVRSSVLEGKKAAPYDATGDINRSTSVFVFPNFTLDIIPGPPNMNAGAWFPIDERRTLGTYDYFFSEGVPQKTIEEMIAFNEQVGLEDNGLVESVHAGLESGMVEHGRLLPTSEHLIQHFQRLIYGYLS